MTATRIAVIDSGIAIVVEAIAYLGGRHRVLIAHDAAPRTRRGSSRTNSRLTGIARRTPARIAIVDGAIAIVVETVAAFRIGENRLSTYERTSRTRRDARRTQSQLTRATRHAAARIALVDRTVAIIVETVANLDARVVVAVARNATVRARRRTGRANAILACIARQTAAGIAIVHGTIAIVVEAVARLGRCGRILIAHDAASRTRRRTRRANALQAGIARQPPTRIAVVDRAIAIVVETVARLGG